MGQVEQFPGRAITSQVDIEVVRRSVRALALGHAFSTPAAGELELVVSELATNILRHSRGGELALSCEASDARTALSVVATDRGPGIADLGRAFSDGFSTGDGLGLGLGLVRRLVDEITVETGETSTRITVRKWRA